MLRSVLLSVVGLAALVAAGDDDDIFDGDVVAELKDQSQCSNS